MKINDKIIKLIKEYKQIPVPITESSHLYTDLGFDSLESMYLLVSIEETCGIVFDLLELEACLQVSQLILLVKSKIKESGYDSASAD